MEDIIDPLETTSQMPAQLHIVAPDTKEGLLHTVAMQRKQLDRMGRRHQGAFAATRRLIERLSARVTRLEAKVADTETRIQKFITDISEMKVLLKEVLDKLTDLETQRASKA